jgi:hypothetical protein
MGKQDVPLPPEWGGKKTDIRLKSFDYMGEENTSQLHSGRNDKGDEFWK